MKKILFSTIFFLGCFLTIHAQNAPDQENNRQEKVKALYVAYITNELQLNSGEAEKFWPAHTQYQSEIKTINKENLPELERQQKILDVKKKYQVIFSRILGPSRGENFFKLDGQFKRKLLDKVNRQK